MKTGFTIIELIISIFILSVAVVGIFSAFSVVTILTSDSSDRLAGTYLAQEGMEIVRNIRDTNWLSMGSSSPNATWVDGLDCALGCEADYATDTGLDGARVMTPWAGTGNSLYINNTSGFYGYDTNNASKTKFKRKIVITPISIEEFGGSDDVIEVTVQVSWDEKATILTPKCSADDCNKDGCSNCIIAEGTLYDWYNNQ